MSFFEDDQPRDEEGQFDTKDGGSDDSNNPAGNPGQAKDEEGKFTEDGGSDEGGSSDGSSSSDDDHDDNSGEFVEGNDAASN